MKRINAQGGVLFYKFTLWINYKDTIKGRDDFNRSPASSPLNSKIRESLPKVPDGFNLFTFRLTVLSVDLTGVISMLPQLERADTVHRIHVFLLFLPVVHLELPQLSYFARYSSILKNSALPVYLLDTLSFLVEAVVRCFLSMQSYYYIAN